MTPDIAMYVLGGALIPLIGWCISVSWMLWTVQKKAPENAEWQELMAMTRQLHKMHDKCDEDGVPVWYVRRSLEQAIGRLADNVDKQTAVFQEQAMIFRELVAELKRRKQE